MPAPPVFWRSPRFKAPLPQGEVEIPAPPAKPSPPGDLLSTLLPIGLMAAVMIGVAFLQPGATTMLFLSVPMILVGGVSYIITRQRQKRDYDDKTLKRQQGYTELLRDTQKELLAYQEQQQQLLLQKDPDPKQCLISVTNMERLLWARSPNDDDFLVVRLGIGNDVPSTIKVKAPVPDDVLNPDPLIKAARSLAEQFHDVPRVPTCLSLRQVGGIGLTGARSYAVETARALLVQIATHHSPDEVKIVAIYPSPEKAPREQEDWIWLSWLPHVWSDDRQRRFLANDQMGAHQLLTTLNDLLNQRRNLLQERRSNEPIIWPFHLVFVFAAHDLTEAEPLLQRLQAEGVSLGAYPIFLRERARDLPKGCQVVIRVGEAEPYWMTLDPKVPHFFEPDSAPRELGNRFADVIAPIRLKKPASLTEMPSSLSLLELLSVRNVEELGVSGRWRGSQKAGRSLIAPIGMRGGGELLNLDLHERVHGPNGLVAGMVGAGKSELLQTLVTSLAVNYHPHKVAFVLVDYKGGGMADPFVKLPHTLGTITNLQQGNLAVRALTSFNVEAQRRLQIFAKFGVNHIDDYQRLYYKQKGQGMEPLPYLVIIVDEFAEMKQEQSEIAKEFIRIARIGRALGFRLILAMQKPAGIVDGQIEANTRFRLCLRVAQTEDSQAMLKRPDAAYLGGVGRAYFQVGANEIYELFQVAWSGAPYDPSGFDSDDPLEITEIALDGNRTTLYRPKRPRRSETQAEDTQLKVLVRHLCEVAARESIQPLPGPWLAPLPETITLDEACQELEANSAKVSTTECGMPTEGWNSREWQPVERWLEPVVGRVDDPKGQLEDRKRPYQGPLRVRLGKEGHLVVYGTPGYGTTTFIQTLATSLARTYSPADVNLYLIDFGGRQLRIFEPLPHVGAVITSDDTERLERLLRFLLNEMERRKRLGVTTLPDYRQTTDASLPAIVVILDNFAQFAKDHDERVDAIAQIAREGGNLGVHLVLTATKQTDISYRVSGNITQVIAFHLAEPTEYAMVIGRTDSIVLQPVPGRGIIKGTPPLEFQAALPIQGRTDAERSAALKTLFQDMRDAWPAENRAKPVRTLPQVVPLSDLLTPNETWDSAEAITTTSLATSIGLDVLDLTPFSVDLWDEPNCLVVGPARSGKTTLLQTWLLALAERFPPDRLHVYLLDSRRPGLAFLAGLPHRRGYAGEQADVDGLLAQLEEELRRRLQAFAKLKRQTAIGSDGNQSVRAQFPEVIVAVDDIFDPFDDLTGASNGDEDPDRKKRLTAILQQGSRLGFHFIVAGSTSHLADKGWSEPIKTLKAASVGFALDTSDDQILNLRLSPSDRTSPLSIGQAYWTQRGRSHKVQLATARAGNPTLETWVKLLAERTPRSQPEVVLQRRSGTSRNKTG